MALVAEGLAVVATVGLSVPITLANDSTGGLYECRVDTSALARGDRAVLVTSVAVRSGGTAREVQRIRIAHAQGDPMVLAAPLEVVPGATVLYELMQTAGTLRSFAYAVTRT